MKCILPPPPQRRDELRYDIEEIYLKLQRENDEFKRQVLESRLTLCEREFQLLTSPKNKRVDEVFRHHL